MFRVVFWSFEKDFSVFHLQFILSFNNLQKTASIKRCLLAEVEAEKV